MGKSEICLWEISKQICMEYLKGKYRLRCAISGIRRDVMRSVSSGILCSVDWECVTDGSGQIFGCVFKCQAVFDFSNLVNRVNSLSQTAANTLTFEAQNSALHDVSTWNSVQLIFNYTVWTVRNWLFAWSTVGLSWKRRCIFRSCKKLGRSWRA